MIFCTKCGTELPDEADFCWKCGQATKTLGGNDPLVGYESCSLTLIRTLTRYLWEARMGSKVIAQSREIWDIPFFDVSDKVHAANHELATQLMADGWKPLTANQLGQVVAMQREKRS